MSIKRNGLPKPGANPLSQSVEANGFLFVSGSTPKDANGHFVGGTIEVQATAALENLLRRVAAAGYEVTDIVRVGVWLDDPRDASEFNKVYKQYFSAEHAPARVCLQGTMIHDCKVELDCIAYRDPIQK